MKTCFDSDPQMPVNRVLAITHCLRDGWGSSISTSFIGVRAKPTRSGFDSSGGAQASGFTPYSNARIGGAYRDHTTLVRPDTTTGEPGAPLDRCLPDSIIEIDNKSITHRPDLWGHLGLAREVAAIVGQRLHDPVKLDVLPAGPAAINIMETLLTMNG